MNDEKEAAQKQKPISSFSIHNSSFGCVKAPMSEAKQSSHWVWVAGGVAVAIVALAGLTGALWPQIELRYHRHYFRRGTPQQQVEALTWMCEERLEKGMFKKDIETILGEPLGKRFEVWNYYTTGGISEQPAMIPVPAFRFPGKNRSISNVNLYLDPNGEMFICAGGDFPPWAESYEETLKRVAPDSIHEYFRRRFNRRRRERRETEEATSP